MSQGDQAFLKTSNSGSYEVNGSHCEQYIQRAEANGSKGVVSAADSHKETVSDALRASELRYRRLFEAAKDGILILDVKTGVIIDVNPFLIDLLGLSHEVFLGRKIWELGLFKDVAANEAKFAELQAKEYVRYDDLPLETSEGKQISVEFVSNVYLESGHKVMQCNIRDISGRKHIEQLLREEAAHHRSLFENMAEGLALCRMLFEADRPKDFIYLDVNAAFERLTGLKNVVGRKVSEVIPDLIESDPDLLVRYGRVAMTGQPERFETYVEALKMWFSISVYCPEKEHFVAVFDVITQRKLTESSHERLAKAVEQAHETIVITDARGQILYTNPAFERITGYTADEVLGQNPSILKSGKHDAEFYQKMWDVLQRGETWGGHLINRRKDGALFDEEATISPVRDADGTVVNYVAVKRDVTQELKVEAQLRQMQKMESIGTLASGIAHDLNNALAPILMSLELLGEHVKDSAGRDLIETMRQSAQHGADLVKQVLSFARGVKGERVAFNLLTLWKDIEKIIHDTFPKNITFSLKADSNLWMVKGDPTQLHQVLMNLCVNARDAIPQGGSLDILLENIVLDDVYASLNPSAKAGSYVVVQVADNGTGIVPEIRQKIFDPFFTTKEVGKGTGMGLSTVMSIVKSHEGFINLYSEERKGSTFRVYLPAVATLEATEETAVKQTKLPMGHGETILLVDDEERVLEVAEKTLVRFGYRVLTASNGAEALAIYAQYREEIAIVLTDMSMPVMDGPATILALKAMNPEVKIIGSSGLAANGNVAKAAGAGVRHFIPKPYTAETMLKTLAQALEEKV